MTVKRFRTKPVEIEAIQCIPENVDVIPEWTEYFRVPNYRPVHTWKQAAGEGNPVAYIFDYLQRQEIQVFLGQWIIKGTKGELYPCDDEVFRAKYEEVE